MVIIESVFKQLYECCVALVAHVRITSKYVQGALKHRSMICLVLYIQSIAPRNSLTSSVTGLY